jgi:AcrR family transcriptional regulator
VSPHPKDPKTRRKPASKTQQPKSRTRRVTKAAQRAEMMEQILDTAEELFSKHGLYGVTLKDVAKQVGVHHTLMNYYFRDKKKLFDEVFARRAVVTSTRRMRALDDYDAATKGKPTIEGALHTFLDTDLDLYIEGGKPGRTTVRWPRRSPTLPVGRRADGQALRSVVLRLIGLLKRALPHCSEEDILWGYHFVSGALLLTLARTGRIDKLSNGRCKSDDFAAVKKRMAKFMAAGFMAVCGD